MVGNVASRKFVRWAHPGTRLVEVDRIRRLPPFAVASKHPAALDRTASLLRQRRPAGHVALSDKQDELHVLRNGNDRRDETLRRRRASRRRERRDEYNNPTTCHATTSSSTLLPFETSWTLTRRRPLSTKPSTTVAKPVLWGPAGHPPPTICVQGLSASGA